MNIRAMYLGVIGSNDYSVIFRCNPDAYLGVEVLNVACDGLSIYMRKWPETEQEKIVHLILTHYVAARLAGHECRKTKRHISEAQKPNCTERHVYLRDAAGAVNDIRVRRYTGGNRIDVRCESWTPDSYGAGNRYVEMLPLEYMLKALAGF